MLTIVLILVILGAWILTSVRSIWSAKKVTGLRRWTIVIGATLMIIGAVGFFGAGIAAFGGLNWLPASFEWPAGYASGVVSSKEGFFVVPHAPSGRVQVYDQNWKFVRGWFVDAAGGVFKLVVSQTNQVEVITSRGQWRYVFDLKGTLLSKEHYAPGSYPDLRSSGASYMVPTAPWLLVFSSPIYSWLSAAAGMAILVLTRRNLDKQRAKINN